MKAGVRADSERDQPLTGAAEDVQSEVDACRLLHVAYRPRMQSEPVTVNLSLAMTALASGAVPVRQPMEYRGQWCKPGWYYFSGLDQHVSYESRFEAAHLMLLDFAGTAARVVAQPFRVHWRQGKALRRHTPDFLVLRRDGTAVVLDVKGTARAAEPKNALVFGVTRRACQEMGVEYRVASDIPETTLRNVQWLAGYKAPALLPGAVEVFQRLMTRPFTCQEAAVLAARELGVVPTLALPVLFHLCWTRALSIDLPEPFSLSTRVGPAGLFPGVSG